MNLLSVAQPWFGSSMPEPGPDSTDRPQEFERLWRGFMTARATLGLVLLLLQGSIYFLGASSDGIALLISLGYFGAALAVRLLASPRPLETKFDLQWLSTIGVDIFAFAALQVAQGSNINYAPLFALPVLMASVLGSLLLALGAAAGVTLLLFAYATWLSALVSGDTPTHFMQAALTGAGCFVIAFLANQIATRLASAELLAQRNQLAARVQRQVNELVIETLTDGILVVDQSSLVRSANPAARLLLGDDRALGASPFELTAVIGWLGLVELMKRSFSSNAAQQADVSIEHVGKGARRVQVRTQLTAAKYAGGECLCVMFLQDQRETEARMRTEKMASMGRMSAAVAHEIRNPLAAITQANALLDEDLTEPRHKQLTQMVQQNAKRLERIVEEVLHISRVQRSENAITPCTLELNGALTRICRDWQSQTKQERALCLDLAPRSVEIKFESEHLRQILVNLLDNACRYATQHAQGIQVLVGEVTPEQVALSVWSDGPPLEESVEKHLFEPFFSSESRSSGLGLYICREICEGYGASIAYRRSPRQVNGKSITGNEFVVLLRPNPSKSGTTLSNASRSMSL